MADTANRPRCGGLHHVELWVPNLGRATASWRWLLETIDYQPLQKWPNRQSWECGDAYIVIQQSLALTATEHDRCRPGLNHLAFHGGSRQDVDHISDEATDHGKSLLFPDRHPFAGGAENYAAYLEDMDGFEAEIVELSEEGR